MDSVLGDHVTDISSPERKLLFHQFLSLSVSSGKFQVSCYLLAQHANTFFYFGGKNQTIKTPLPVCVVNGQLGHIAVPQSATPTADH